MATMNAVTIPLGGLTAVKTRGGCKVVAGKVERYSKNNGKSNNKCCRAAVPIPMACEADQRKVGLKGQGRNSDVELAPCAIR